jgi:hypothetical protein
MTDQPTTQEICPTCLRTNQVYPDPWHGSQDVEGDNRLISEPLPPAPELVEGAERAVDEVRQATTQEAEKALETLKAYIDAAMPRYVPAEAQTEALAALRSLRTQHTEQQEQLAQARKYHSYFADKYSVAQAQHTKDREEIERLKALKNRYAEWIVREVKKGPRGPGITAEELPAWLEAHRE